MFVTLLKDVSIFFIDSSKLFVLVYIHSIYLLGLPIYFHCGFWRDMLFFQHTELVYSITFHGKVFLFISIVYVLYTF